MPLPLTVSCFSKIQIGTFLVPAHPGRPGQRAIKRGMMSECFLSGCGQGPASNFYIVDLENFATASRRYTGDIHNSTVVGLFMTHCLQLNFQLHTIGLVRTCPGNWQDYY